MDTLTIQISNSKALKLIEDMEALNLIKVIKPASKKPKKNLSALLAGSITKKQADKFHTELKQMREGWERDTY